MNVKIPSLSTRRILLVVSSLALTCLVLTGCVYLNYSSKTFSTALTVQWIVLTILSGIVGPLPRILYKYGIFSEEYEDFKRYSGNMYQAYRKLEDDGIVEPKDTGHTELRDFLIQDGDFEADPSDRAIIEHPSPDKPRMDIQIDGELSGNSLLTVYLKMEESKKKWEKRENKIEKERNSEYAKLGLAIFLMATSLQFFRLFVA